jgi:Na+-driven multidrug efflux pump
MSMLVMVAVQQIVVFKTLAIHGSSDHIALMAAAFRVLLFALVPLTGTGQGLQPVVGVNHGAKNHGRVIRAYRCFTLIATAMAASVWLLFMLVPGAILGWFFTDRAFVVWGCRYFRVFLSLFLLMGLNITTIIFFQALGKGGRAAVLALSKQALLFIPLVLVLPLFMGAMGVWLAMPLADGLTFFLAVGLLAGTFRRLGALRRTAEPRALRIA